MHADSRCRLCRVLWALELVLLVFALLLASPRARAQETVAGFVGEQSSGLPGIGRVAVASPRPLHVAAALGAGYGLTEAQGADSGSHHRVSGSVGLAVQPLRFLSGALVLDGRYDSHPNDVLGSSSSGIGEPRLVARVADAVGKSFAVGGQLVLWVPGGEAPSVRLEASTLDLAVLATFAPPGTELALALNAGYRVDQSAGSIDAQKRPRLRPGDRLSLQASDFDAVLLGLGASKRIDRIEVLGELTWDVLVGSGAPSAVESPVRAAAGARYHMQLGVGVLRNVQLELRSEIGLGERPPSGALAPFAPIEPRFAVLAGLRWVLPLGREPAATKPAPPGPVAVKPPPPRPAGGSVRGKISTETGEPIPGVHLTLKTATEPIDERTAESGADGSFALEDVRQGRVQIIAKAAGFVDTSAEASVDPPPAAAASVNLAMKRAIKPGQLRGLVRSFNGKPLAATIRVEPLGVETKTDADGLFQIDVPPGSYEVVVAAAGHSGQRRPVQVEENGVTILNADLRAGP